MAQRTAYNTEDDDGFEIIPDLTQTDKVEAFEVIGECHRCVMSFL